MESASLRMPTATGLYTRRQRSRGVLSKLGPVRGATRLTIRTNFGVRDPQRIACSCIAPHSAALLGATSRADPDFRRFRRFRRFRHQAALHPQEPCPRCGHIDAVDVGAWDVVDASRGALDELDELDELDISVDDRGARQSARESVRGRVKRTLSGRFIFLRFGVALFTSMVRGATSISTSCTDAPPNRARTSSAS